LLVGGLSVFPIRANSHIINSLCTNRKIRGNRPTYLDVIAVREIGVCRKEAEMRGVNGTIGVFECQFEQNCPLLPISSLEKDVLRAL